MYRLLEIVYSNGKESPALYPTADQEPFKDETALVASYETKLGADMKAEAYKVAYLLAFDHTGKIYGQEYHTKDEEISLSPRLISVKSSKSEGEIPDQKKETDMTTLEADFHSSKGAAMDNPDVQALLQMQFNGKSVTTNDYWVRTTYPTDPVTT